MGRLAVKPKLVRDAVMPRIRELDRQGETQMAIALEVGCCQSTVQKWLYAENGPVTRRPGRPAQRRTP